MTGLATHDAELSADLVYSHAGGRPRLLDLYLPRGSARPLPVILWLHAGGWRSGDRKQAPDLSRHFAMQGFAMASMDYRLSREATFPAQLHDVKAAVRWLRMNGERLGLDGRRIGLWGSSAGGHLATLAALTPGDEGSESLGSLSTGAVWLTLTPIPDPAADHARGRECRPERERRPPASTCVTERRTGGVDPLVTRVDP